MANCPLCRMELMCEPSAFGDPIEHHCHNCGVFRLSGTAAAIVANTGYSPMERAKLSYGLRRMDGNTLSAVAKWCVMLGKDPKFARLLG